MTEKDIIQQIAVNNGLDPRQLALVYRVEARDTAVVWKNNGAFVADVVQLQYNFTDVANASETAAVRQAMLNDEYHSNPIGSAFGSERSKRDPNGNLVSYSFKGTFQYAFPEAGSIYSGSFSTGKALKDTSQSGG
jgi:hypothetical protein